MRKISKVIVSIVALSAMTTQAFAGGTCTRAPEAAALKAETLQQQLMVAALACHEARAYNAFVISHRQELQDTDATAQGFFQRISADGAERYQTYKTKLANDFSMDSSSDTDNFCSEADAVFQDANYARGESLNAFVASLQMYGDEPYAACDRREASDDDGMVAGASSGVVRARR